MIEFFKKLFGFETPEEKEVRQKAQEAKKTEQEVRFQDYITRKKFKEMFGFPPELLTQDRYKKELLLRLGIRAKELKEKAEDSARLPHIYRSRYEEASATYTECIQVIEHIDKGFGQQIPHWTELHDFTQRWIEGEKFRSRQRPASTARVSA